LDRLRCDIAFVGAFVVTSLIYGTPPEIGAPPDTHQTNQYES
jgi:hypothetical protein